VNSFYVTKKGGDLNANISYRLDLNIQLRHIYVPKLLIMLEISVITVIYNENKCVLSYYPIWTQQL